MNLDDLLKEMKEKMQSRDLSDKYLKENDKTTRTEMGIGEYSYGITTVPCEWVYDFLSDYKRVLKENEELKNQEATQRKINELLVQRYSNSISVQEVKAKIEEVDIAILECEYLDDDDEEYKKAVEKDKLCLLNQKRALQELLEKGVNYE